MAAQETNPAGQTVPDVLLGCWRREWIRFADGTFDDRSEVVWLQTRTAMADLRLDEATLAVDVRSGPGDYTDVELSSLARSESSSGITRCTAVRADGTATASWHAGTDGIDYQPVSAFPEPGLLSWSSDGSVMTERAPSGAYVEQWQLVPHTRAPLVHTIVDHAMGCGRTSSLFVAGSVAMLVRDRDRRPAASTGCGAQRCGEPEPEPEVSSRAALEAFVDCEFSFAVRTGDTYAITLSTLPWRRGEHLDVLVDRAS